MMALRHRLPQGVTPAQVHCTLTASARRMFAVENTFDEQGGSGLGLPDISLVWQKDIFVPEVFIGVP